MTTLTREFTVTINVPVVLPDAAPPPEQAAHSLLVTAARNAGYTLDPAPPAQVGPAVAAGFVPGERIRPDLAGQTVAVSEITWRATGSRVEAAAAEAVTAVADAAAALAVGMPVGERTAAVALPEVLPPILSVHHPLATDRVAARVFDGRGADLGQVDVMPISDSEVEAAAVGIPLAATRLVLAVVPDDGEDDVSEEIGAGPGWTGRA